MSSSKSWPPFCRFPTRIFRRTKYPWYSYHADLTRYFDEHVSDAQREAANRYVLDDMKSHLDKQDAEEGY